MARTAYTLMKNKTEFQVATELPEPD